MMDVSLHENQKLFFRIYLNDELNYLKCSWHGYTDVNMVKEGSNLLLHYISAYKVSGLLVDNRFEEGPWSDSQGWILDRWMPRVKSIGLEKTAILPSKDMFSLVSAKEYERRARLRGFKTKLFNEEEEATQWLL